MGNAMISLDVIDKARTDCAAKSISRAEAVKRILSCDIKLTEAGAEDLLDHELSATQRYREAFDGLRGKR